MSKKKNGPNVLYLWLLINNSKNILSLITLIFINTYYIEDIYRSKWYSVILELCMWFRDDDINKKIGGTVGGGRAEDAKILIGSDHHGQNSK